MVRPKLPHLSVKSQHKNEQLNKQKQHRSPSPFRRSPSPFRKRSVNLFNNNNRDTDKSAINNRSNIAVKNSVINNDNNSNNNDINNHEKTATSSTVSTATTAIFSNHLTDKILNNDISITPFESSIEYISLFTTIPEDLLSLEEECACLSISSQGSSTTCPTITSNSTSSINATYSISSSLALSPKQRVQYSILQYKNQLEFCDDKFEDYPFRNHLLQQKSIADKEDLSFGTKPHGLKSFYTSINELQSSYNKIIKKRDYEPILDFTKTALASITHLSSSSEESSLKKLAQILHNVSIIHVWNYNLSLAMKCIQETLYLRRNIYANLHHLDIVLSLCELGFLQYAREQYTYSLSSYREALQVYCTLQQQQGDDSNLTDNMIPRILNNISCIHYQMEKYTLSHHTLEESFHLLKKMTTTMHEEEEEKKSGNTNNATSLDLLCQISIVQSNLAFLNYYAFENNTLGISILEEALMIQESIFEDDHFIVGCTSHYLNLMNMKAEKQLQNQELIGDWNVATNCSANYVDNDKKFDVAKTKIQILFGEEDGIPYSSSYADNNVIGCGCIQLGPVLLSSSPSRPSEYTPMQRIHETLFSFLKPRQQQYPPILKRPLYSNCVTVESISEPLLQKAELNFQIIYTYILSCTEQGKADQAIYVLKKVQHNLQEKYGKDHHLLGTTFHNLGIVYLLTKQYSKSVKYFQHGLMIRRNVLGDGHPDVMISLRTIGMVYFALENYESALSTFSYVLAAQRKKLGYNHLSVAITLNNIGCIHFQNGGLLSSLKSLEEAIDILRAQQTQHRALAQIFMNYGFIRMNRKEYGDAIIILQEALQLHKGHYDSHGNSSSINNDVWLDAKVTIDNLAYSMALANHQEDEDEQSLENLVNMYTDMLRW